MPTKKHGIIIETPGEARQAEPGPSVLVLLTISTGLAALILGGLWEAVELRNHAANPSANA